MPISDNTPPDEFSKSKRKREMLDLQKTGETLVGLAPALLEKISLPDDLRDAVNHAKSLKSHEAKRRQMQYIGKIMRDMDVAPINLELQKLKASNYLETANFHQIEKWRDQLIAKGDDALQEFMLVNPGTDRAALKKVIVQAQNDREHNNSTGGETALFRYLRELLQK